MCESVGKWYYSERLPNLTYVHHLIALEMCGKVLVFSAVLRPTWQAFKFRELYHILKISAQLSIFLNESLHFSLIRLQRVYTLAVLMKQKLWVWKYSKSITEHGPQLVLRTECHYLRSHFPCPPSCGSCSHSVVRYAKLVAALQRRERLLTVAHG